VWKVLKPLDRSADPRERGDAGTLRSSFDRCYYRNIAMREGAMLSSEDSNGLRGVRRRAALEHADTTRMVVFPHDYKLQLGALSAHEWTSYVDSIEAQLHSWWYEWDISALQEIGNRLADVTSSHSVPSTGKGAVSAFISAASGGVSSLATSSPLGIAIGAGVGIATWIVEDSASERLGQWNRRRATRYDVVEVRPPEPDPSESP